MISMRCFLFALIAFWAGSIEVALAVKGTPKRVVSMNLCTDQLAMLLAGEGQLYSVSFLASDPLMSSMVAEAKAYPQNRGRAEEIYLMQPDLVLAGAYTTPATVAMLKKLGIDVAIVDMVNSLDELPQLIEKIGGFLGRETAAEALNADYKARLADLRQEINQRPRAVLYYANGYSSGNYSLANEILTTAGFSNAALERGYSFGKMPLEVLALIAPDLVVSSRSYPGNSRSEAILEHPVVKAFRQGESASLAYTNQDWVCSTPYLLRAIEDLKKARDSFQTEGSLRVGTGEVIQ